MAHLPVKLFLLEPIFDEYGNIKRTRFINGIAYPFYKKHGEDLILQGSHFPGAVIDANCYGNSKYPGPDGRSLVVTLPSLETWCIDGPSNNGPGWIRTGSLEDGTLNVTPSILTIKYHGWIKDGYLVEA